MSSNEEDNSIWLFDVLNTIGINDEYRIVRRNQGIICEILESFEYRITTLNMGSTIEGTDSPGEKLYHRSNLRRYSTLTIISKIGVILKQLYCFQTHKHEDIADFNQLNVCVCV